MKPRKVGVTQHGIGLDRYEALDGRDISQVDTRQRIVALDAEIASDRLQALEVERADRVVIGELDCAAGTITTRARARDKLRVVP